MMILPTGPDFLDLSCVLVPATPQESHFLNFTILPATCPPFLIGYQTYTPPATLSPNTLATTIATNLPQQTSLQQLPLTTQPSCVATAVPFRPSLPAGAAPPLSNGLRLLNGFPINRTSYPQKRGAGHFRGGTHNTGFRPGFKRKLDDVEENNGKPESLTDMMRPLYCKLCKVVLNAPAQAKQHYEGKNHLRKVKMFEEGKEDDDSGQEAQVSSTTSPEGSTSSSPPRAGTTTTGTTLPSSPSSAPDPIDPEIYCQTCGVSFNSIKQSQQHYQGKNHAKRVRAIQSEGQGVSRKPWGHTSSNKVSSYTCTACKVSLSSKEQYDGHCLTASHHALLTMLEKNSRSHKGRWPGGPPQHHRGSPPSSSITSGKPASASSASLHRNTPPAKKTRTDFMNYRLPSGKFYCSMCNMTINNESAMAHHVDSRKHRSAFAAKKTEEMAEECTKT